MIRLDTEQRLDVLREVALLLQRENDRLHQRIECLTRELAAAKGVGTETLQLEIEELRDLLARREQEIFGDSSEKRRHVCGSKSKDAPHGHGRAEQPTLPIVEEIHTLDEPDRICPTCGGHLVEMTDQFEESEEITVVERQFIVKKHRRQKYRCRCNGHVETALGPAKLQDGGRYSPEFAVEVATSKYLDHLPLERQVRVMSREGLTATSQTLYDQIEIMARHLKPTYEAIQRLVLSAPVVGADETHWRVMGQKDEKKRWWVWSVASPSGVYFKILDSRSEQSASSVLSGYRGVIIADGYKVYDSVARGDPDLVVANCWAHVRRKFVEAEENFPLPCRQILDLIGELYEVERSVHAGVPADDEVSYHSALSHARRSRSKEVLSRIRHWASEQRVLPHSGLGRAIAYMNELWPGLTRFVEDSRVPLDNNAVERAIRAVVLGRKNHYGSRSRRGTEVAALFYTLIETAKLRGVEPKAYLRRALLAAISSPGAATLPEIESNEDGQAA